MKGILYYFSGTGNTKWVAKKFEEQFIRHGKELELRSIERIENLDLEGYDYLIIGTPVHSELPPKIVVEFLNRLPEGNKNIKCMIYSTQGVNSAAAVDDMKRLLEKKGYEIIVQTSFRMANSYYFGFGVERTPEEIAKFSKNAEEKVKRIAEEVFKNNKVIEKISYPRFLFGKLTGHGFNRLLPKLASKLSSTEECNKCGLCLRNCPRGNITIEDGRAFFHSNCIMCVRCIHLCPVNAIRYKGKKINQILKDRIKVLDLR